MTKIRTIEELRSVLRGDLLSDPSGAVFGALNECRYALWRIWDYNKPRVMFIGLNPSTANGQKDDPTIRRVVAYAKAWGYGGVYMMNLFTQVTPYPRELNMDGAVYDDLWLKVVGEHCQDVVFCWGAFKEARQRAAEVAAMFPHAKALAHNKDCSPHHPLRLRSDITLIPFIPF